MTNDAQLIIEEQALVARENSDYSKMLYQLIAVFFAFTATTMRFGSEDENWAWILLQLMTPVFFIGCLVMERDIILNSLYMCNNEIRINEIVGNKILFWQNYVGVEPLADDVTVRRIIFSPLVFLLLFISVYSFPIFAIFNQLNTPYNAMYVILSYLIFIYIFYYHVNDRKESIKLSKDTLHNYPKYIEKEASKHNQKHRCNASTRKGMRCKNLVKTNEEKCWIHRK